jgi:hypothetical protein
MPILGSYYEALSTLCSLREKGESAPENKTLFPPKAKRGWSSAAKTG